MERTSKCIGCLTPKLCRRLGRIWEAINIGIIGLNSFVMLYFRRQSNINMKQVIAVGAVAYALVLLVETIALNNEKRLRWVRVTKKIFRLIYTGIYLTCIMLDILAAKRAGEEEVFTYYAISFVWVAIWGTNCLWLKSLLRLFENFLKKHFNQRLTFH